MVSSPPPFSPPLSFSSHSSSNSMLNSLGPPAGPSRSALTSNVGRAGGSMVTVSEPERRVTASPASSLSATLRRYVAISSRVCRCSDLNNTSSGISCDRLAVRINTPPLSLIAGRPPSLLVDRVAGDRPTTRVERDLPALPHLIDDIQLDELLEGLLDSIDLMTDELRDAKRRDP